MIKPLKQWSPQALRRLNGVIVVGSAFLCALALPLRLPGMELAGTGPNWLLIWVVTWSVKRSAFSGALAGVVPGTGPRWFDSKPSNPCNWVGLSWVTHGASQ